MKLTILGSGSPEAYARRASSGYLVEAGSDRILFDCGGGVVDTLLRSGRTPSDITHLVFSHFHSDHMMDYARLVHAAWDEGAPPLKVFGPPPLAEVTAKLFGRDGVFAHDLVARTEFAPSQDVWVARGGTLPRPWPAPEVTILSENDVIEGDGWRIESCEVPHAQPHLSCLGFALDCHGKRFAYSGDAGLCASFERLAKGADLLLHWCYRLDGEAAAPVMEALTPTPGQIGALAKRVGAGSLLLTHFRKHMDGEAQHARALSAVRAAFDGPAGIAEDLMVVDM